MSRDRPQPLAISGLSPVTPINEVKGLIGAIVSLTTTNVYMASQTSKGRVLLAYSGGLGEIHVWWLVAPILITI